MTALTTPAMASPGDTYTITGDRVNVRSGPTDRASIRTTVGRGDELLELRQDGNWTGVRVLRTGEEGWVFSDLLRQRSASTLGSGASSRSSFARYSSGFDRLIGRVNEELGYSFAERVEAGEDGLLRVTPTQEWLFNTSREAKIYAAMALYEMWKNHNNGRPVSVALGARGANPIMIEDGTNGPLMELPALVGSSR
ncbi:MAG TPA: SH3 domain-containing protein [Azospirillum sp.]|nr:SH3 domain-containing protein [Azospirillum sp.]